MDAKRQPFRPKEWDYEESCAKPHSKSAIDFYGSCSSIYSPTGWPAVLQFVTAIVMSFISLNLLLRHVFPNLFPSEAHTAPLARKEGSSHTVLFKVLFLLFLFVQCFYEAFVSAVALPLSHWGVPVFCGTLPKNVRSFSWLFLSLYLLRAVTSSESRFFTRVLPIVLVVVVVVTTIISIVVSVLQDHLTHTIPVTFDYFLSIAFIVHHSFIFVSVLIYSMRLLTLTRGLGLLPSYKKRIRSLALLLLGFSVVFFLRTVYNICLVFDVNDINDWSLYLLCDVCLAEGSCFGYQLYIMIWVTLTDRIPDILLLAVFFLSRKKKVKRVGKKKRVEKLDSRFDDEFSLADSRSRFPFYGSTNSDEVSMPDGAYSINSVAISYYNDDPPDFGFS
ncbi:hypothetical protein BLNAU_6694 [Blattamonas nauphoetae]|uniref:Transmembrane protein n=1 Tax=Blattamonas nauphoetae TaxID=2049346 RepID=A0ABQ9Y3Z1_9EUKA|nr:hypothetical protein BLNAU_6694 [Blattamonas nauphoetae]